MAVDIADWVESKLERATKSAGDEWTASCPRCDKWSTFYINAETGAFVCFACEFRGKSLVGVIAEVEGCSWAEAAAFLFKESVKFRRKGDIVTIRERARLLRSKEAEPEPPAVDAPLPREFKPVFGPKGWSFPGYLKQRRVKPSTAKRWGMGYCRVGKYAGRLIIPIVCPAGHSFTARDMIGDQEPKYLNPPAADHRRLLIGWNVAKLTGDFCIVEGPLDAVKMDQHGIPTLAVGGKVLHSEQLKMLFSLSEQAAVTVLLDPEEATAPFDVASQLSVHFERIYIARLPMGTDPGDSTKSQAAAALERAARFKGARGARTSALLERSRARAADRFRGA